MSAPFQPTSQATNQAVTGTSARFALGTGEQIRLCNSGSADVFYRFTNVAGDAVVTDACLKAGVTEIVSRPRNIAGVPITHLAVISATTSTLNYQFGIGI